MITVPWLSQITYFYPRSPCGERLMMRLFRFPIGVISIHALLAESDHDCFCRFSCHIRFLSTLSLRRATLCFIQPPAMIVFLSTLSLRRATLSVKWQFKRYINFYPRSPCGERLLHCTTYLNCSLFLSTLSLRRATCSKSAPCEVPTFLSTLSLRRAT